MPQKTASPADAALEEAAAKPGDRVRVTSQGRAYEGVLMRRHAFSAPDIVVLKLDSGYNVGLAVGDGTSVERLDAPPRPERQVPGLPTGVEGLPTIALLGTGGTIASFVEYRTGAVFPATSPEELAAAVPEAFQHAKLEPRIVYETFSEDLSPEHWEGLAQAIVEAFEGGARGVVVTHGTDTLHFTAAALQCTFDALPGPVVLVGAQRSSDRPSSDAATNLVAAVRLAASADAGEVLLVMHEGMSDDAWSVHAAGRARKMHASRRDAFQSLNAAPLARITPDAIDWRHAPRAAAEAVARTGGFEADVGLVWSYPSLSEDELRAAAGKGLVLAGTGLGHVARRLIPTVKELVEAGTVVAVTTQCLYGRTNLKVYETGRELLQAGVVDAGDMMPETAYVKLSWALAAANGDADRARELLLAPRGRETSDRTTFHFLGGASP